MQLNSPEWKEIIVGIIAAILQGSLLPFYAVRNKNEMKHDWLQRKNCKNVVNWESCSQVIFGEYLGVLSEPDAEVAQSEANKFALLFLGLGLGAGTAMFLQMFMFTISGEALTARLRKQTFNAMLMQELGWYDDPNNNIGALCARLSGDAAHVQGVSLISITFGVLCMPRIENVGSVGWAFATTCSQATGSIIGTVIQSIATLVIAISLAMYYEARLGAVALVFVPLVVLATYYQMTLMMGQDLGEKKAVDEASKIAVQAVGNIRTVASLCKEKSFVKLYNSHLTNSHK